MKISVLIPTHNRPKLFERCIQSVFDAYDQHPVDLEIIVNNDSNDIVEQHKDGIDITYNYYKDSNLSKIYKMLFDQANKEYIYYLEDDDIMDISFFDTLAQHSADIYYFNYHPYKFNLSFIKYFTYTAEHLNNNKEQFLASFDDHNFQFSQMCFKKSALPEDQFPTDNYLKNDFLIFKRLQGTFKPLNVCLYRQTTDGQDNISFKAYNKDPRWTSQYS